MNTKQKRPRGEPPLVPLTVLESDVIRFHGNAGLEAVHKSLTDLRDQVEQDVRKTPDAYGAGADAESQRMAVEKTMEDFRLRHLWKVTSEIRHKAGYIRLLGTWIHRSIITYAVYIVTALFFLSYLLPMIFSPDHGAWWKGLFGTILTVTVAVLINVRVIQQTKERDSH